MSVQEPQRYAFDSFGPAHPGGVIIHADDGPYVTYEDARRLVAEAVAEARADMVDAARWHQGAALFLTSRDIDRVCRLARAEGVQAARDAVAAKRSDFAYATDTQDGHILLRIYDDALAAIDALRGESND